MLTPICSSGDVLKFSRCLLGRQPEAEMMEFCERALYKHVLAWQGQ